MPARIVAAAAAALLCSAAMPPAAHAQSNPNADQILNSLMPRAGMAGGTRGIRPAGAPPPAALPGEDSRPAASPAASRAAMRAPARSPAGTARAPSEADGPSVTLSVQFATNSADLSPATMRTLDQLGLALSSPKLAGDRFRVEGHTDTVGAPEANRTLSARRADAVVAYLADKFNVARDHLQASGMGEDGLLVRTGPGVSELRNRRVVVVNLGA